MGTSRWLPARLALAVVSGALTTSLAYAQDPPCAGDCDGDGRVALGELVQAVNVGLGKRGLGFCPRLDVDDSGRATVDEMVLAVERSLNGCPRMLQGAEAVRGTSQVTLSTMDSFRVLSFGFVGPGPGGGGGAGAEEPVLCDQGSKTVTRLVEGARCTITTVYSACVESDLRLAGDVTRDGTVIQTIAAPEVCSPPGAIPDDVNVSVTLSGYTEEFTDSDDAGVELFAANLVLAREPMQSGASRTKLEGSLRVRRTTGERFTQLFQNFVITETPGENGSVLVTQSGRVAIDCIGDLEIKTTLPIVLASSEASCPVAGEVEVAEASSQKSGAGASLLASRAVADAVGSGQQTAVDDGFGANLYRASNGPVYQVLQNAGADADEGSEAVRITTLVGSTGSASACESSAGGGRDATAIAAAATSPFALESVRKSALIRDATPPCFNGNAENGQGTVCIGPGCGADCGCNDGEPCVAFTLDDGTAISQASEGVPAAELADLRDAEAGPCSGFAYAFGTSEPTTRAAECAVEPTEEGFLVPVVDSEFAGGTDGSTIVFAYDAPLLSDFRASHAGFSVDLDGKNRVGCLGSGTLLGLGIADTDRTPPPRIGFTAAGGIEFDFDGRDDVLNGLVETCRFPALAACVGPTGATPTPVPADCPEVALSSAASVFASDSTDGRDNSVGGASCGDGGNQAPDVTFSYAPPASGLYQIDTSGSSFDTILYVRQGSCSGVELACNDDDGGSSRSKLVVSLTAGEPVVVAVDGFGGARGSVQLRIDAIEAAPTATPTRTPAAQADLLLTNLDGPSSAGPGMQIDVAATARNDGLREASAFDVAFVLSTNETITEDDTVLGLCSFSQLATGTSVSCSRSVSLPAELSPGLYFLGAIADFSRRVGESNEANNASVPLGIGITPAGPSPTPAPVCPQLNLQSASSATAQGSTFGLPGNQGGSACGDGGGSAPDLTYGFTAPASGVYTIDTLGSSFDTLLQIRKETCSGIEVACSDDDPQSGTLQSRLTLFLLAGERIVIVVDGFGAAAGAFTLNVRQDTGGVPTSTPVERIATPTPSRPQIRVGSTSGMPGSLTSFAVSLNTAGQPIAGVQNDIDFAAGVSVAANAQTRPDCQVNAAIDKNATAFTYRPSGCVPGVSCTGIRVLVLAFDNVDPIPDGAVLYTCNASIATGIVGGTRVLACQNPAASRPDGSSIEPSCLAGSVDVVGAPTATPTPTPVPTGPVIRVGQASGGRGEAVTFDVRLETVGAAIVAVQNDLSFDADVPVAVAPGSRPDCQANPAIMKDGTAFSFQPPGCTPGASCTGLRAIVLSLDFEHFDDPIPDGAVLYSCSVGIGPSAGIGLHSLGCSGPGGSDAVGNAIGTGCTSGSIVVTGSGPTSTPTPTPTPASNAVILVGSTSGSPGEEVFFDVTLRDGGLQIAGLQNDLAFDSDTPIAARANDRPDCTVNPEIDKSATIFSYQPSDCLPGVTCTSVRAIVISFSNVDPIPDGAVLYTCRLAIDAGASLGFHPLACSNQQASDPVGNAIELPCSDGMVDVKSP